MFQMDDEATLSPSDTTKGKAAMRGIKPAEVLENRSYPDSPALGASIPAAESLGDQSFLDEQLSSLRGTLLAESPTESRAIALQQKRAMTSLPDSSLAPWGSPVISNSKKDLKDIIGETSQSRVSNLTLKMAERRESSGNFTSKISQKERKKMQQQQMQEQLAAQQKAKDAPKNPWQLPTPATPSTPGKDPLPSQSRSSTPASEPTKAAQKPSMTLRQTVAGTPPPQSKPMATPVQSDRRTASAIMQPSSFSKPSPSGPPTPSQQPTQKTSPQPAIQSIRHIPPPDAYQSGSRSPSNGSLSLATILQQQQTEKDVIREAAMAKHNLQEIQAEQEFQQWWDQESKRVQGLLDPEPNPQRGGKGGRGGKASGAAGSSRKRRGNKNAAANGPGAGTPGQKPAPAPTPPPTTPRKNANAPVPVHSQGIANGNQAADAGMGKNARCGGSAHRGKGRDPGS